jgi:hypothetical protein
MLHWWTEQDIGRGYVMSDIWEQLRSVIFTGRRLGPDEEPQSQEDYIEHFESQIERNPLEEWKLIKQAAQPILQTYRQEQEAIERMERMIRGESIDESEPDVAEEDNWIERLYEDIANLETEDEWLAFKGRYLKALS